MDIFFDELFGKTGALWMDAKMTCFVLIFAILRNGGIPDWSLSFF
jgi:hypothetical protein